MAFGPLVVVLPFGGSSRQTLEALTDEVVLPKERRPLGKSEVRSIEYFGGRAALALAFRELGLSGTKVAPDPVWGYLSTNDSKGIYTNLSHTEQVAVAVVADSPIGVDIENVERDVTRVLKRIATDEEASYHQGRQLTVCGGEVPDAVALWSAKEALSKALGLGMRYGLQDFLIALEGPMPFRATSLRPGPFSLTQPAVTLFRWDRYVISVAAERDILDRGVTLRSLLLSSL